MSRDGTGAPSIRIALNVSRKRLLRCNNKKLPSSKSQTRRRRADELVNESPDHRLCISHYILFCIWGISVFYLPVSSFAIARTVAKTSRRPCSGQAR